MGYPSDFVEAVRPSDFDNRDVKGVLKVGEFKKSVLSGLRGPFCPVSGGQIKKKGKEN